MFTSRHLRPPQSGVTLPSDSLPAGAGLLGAEAGSLGAGGGLLMGGVGAALSTDGAGTLLAIGGVTGALGMVGSETVSSVVFGAALDTWNFLCLMGGEPFNAGCRRRAICCRARRGTLPVFDRTSSFAFSAGLAPPLSVSEASSTGWAVVSEGERFLSDTDSTPVVSETGGAPTETFCPKLGSEYVRAISVTNTGVGAVMSSRLKGAFPVP